MERIGEIWDLARVRDAAVKVGGVDDKSVSLPMPDRVSHKQPDVFPKMLAPVEMDDAACVIVVVQEHHGAWPLQESVWVGVIFTLEQTGQRAAGVELDVAQILRRIHIQKELA